MLCLASLAGPGYPKAVFFLGMACAWLSGTVTHRWGWGDALKDYLCMGSISVSLYKCGVHSAPFAPSTGLCLWASRNIRVQAWPHCQDWKQPLKHLPVNSEVCRNIFGKEREDCLLPADTRVKERASRNSCCSDSVSTALGVALSISAILISRSMQNTAYSFFVGDVIEFRQENYLGNL